MGILVQQTNHGNGLAEEPVPEPAVVALTGAVSRFELPPAIAGIVNAAEHAMRRTGDELRRDGIVIKCPSPTSLRILKQRLCVGKRCRRLTQRNLHIQIVIAMPEMIEQGVRVRIDKRYQIVATPCVGHAVIQRHDVGVGLAAGEALCTVAMLRRAKTNLFH